MPKQKKRNLSRKSFPTKRLAFFLIALGLIFTLIPSIFYLNQSIQLAFFTPTATPTSGSQTLPKPTRVIIPKIQMTLPVGETTISDNVWGVYEDGASYLTRSARPGEHGSIVFYAHNTKERFGPIRWLSKNDEINIQTADGKTHTYKIAETFEVSPDKMEIFDQTSETLILYTCTGFGDLKRFVVIAKPL